MAAYELDDIVAYNFGNKMFCIDCVDESDIIDQNGIITQKDIDAGDKLYFCDSCNEKIN